MSSLPMSVFETSFGPVPVWGRPTDRSKPLLFVIRGAGAPPDHLFELTDTEGADVAFVHLPGNVSRYFERNCLADFAKAFDEVVVQLRYARVIALGVSIGGIAATLMRRRERLLLLDTPLTTADLWPLKLFTDRIEDNPAAARWYADILGPGDYTKALEAIDVPADVLVGNDPLDPPRPLQKMPSLVRKTDRLAYAAHPLVRFVGADGAGHNVAAEAPAVFARLLRQAVQVTSDQAVSPLLAESPVQETAPPA